MTTEAQYVCNFSSCITPALFTTVDDTQRLTPKQYNGKNVSQAALLRSVSIVIANTLLSPDLTSREYCILKDRLIKCFKDFQEDVVENRL